MRLIDNFFFVDIEFKIKLPCADRVGNISFLVSNCQTDLNKFSFLNISSNKKIFGLLFRAWSLNVIPVNIDTWKLGVHRNHIEFLSHLH